MDVEFMARQFGGSLEAAELAARAYAENVLTGHDWTMRTIFEHGYRGPGRNAIGYEVEQDD